MPKQKTVFLCHLDDLDDPGAQGFVIEIAGQRQDLFVVRRHDRVRAYLNRCPHTGVCLDWQPDAFLSEEQTHIVCSMHGALFRIEDGFCVAGPCRGDSLASLKLEVDDNERIHVCVSDE